MFHRLFLSVLLIPAAAFGQNDPAVFKSSVSLARVDAQVLDRTGRAVTGLQLNDFILRIGSKVVPIQSFASENMPLDILLLLDVSGSMEPHVQRIANAAHEALNVLATDDRVAVMVFDSSTRVRLPFRNSHSEVTGELNRVLRSEHFNGGTRITRALMDAATYVRREARPLARRAIVILTDDETQDEENEPRVEGALAEANAILSFLEAPYEPPMLQAGGGRRRGTWGGGGGGMGWPGGGGIGFPGGGPIGFPRGGGGGGPYGGMDPSHTAGTATIASDSGGDTIRVDEASALQDTLERLRQRYTLNFYMPEGIADQSSVHVDLAQNARIRYPNSEVRSRRAFMSGDNPRGTRPPPTVVTRTHPDDDFPSDNSATSSSADETDPTRTITRRRRVAVNEDSSAPRVNTTDDPPPNSDPQQSSTPAKSNSPASKTQSSGGWPRAPQPQP